MLLVDMDRLPSDKQMDRQADRLADRQPGGQPDRHTDRQADTETGGLENKLYFVIPHPYREG